MQIGNLTVRLGVDADTFKVKDFVHALGDIPFSVAAGVTALTGMSFAFTDIMKNTLGLANRLTMFTSITGESADELQRWNFVAKGLGLNADSVQTSVEKIVQTMAAMKRGQVDQNFLKGLSIMGVGLDMQHPFAMLWKALVKAQTMAASDSALGLGLMGIDATLKPIGAGANPSTSRSAARGVILDQQGVDAMKGFQVAITNLETTLQKSFVKPLEMATPVIGQLATQLGKFVDLVSPILIHGVGKTLGVIAGIEKKGFENYVDDIVAGINSPSARADDLARYRGKMLHMEVTNHIYSNGDTRAVAEVVTGLMGRLHQKATSAFNNGGQ